jgi:16S rRNA (uracil1498-N3)-methyltransferase
MTEKGPRTRLYLEAPLATGARIALEASRVHYLRSVLRLRPGAPVALFNRSDGEWQARIAELGKNRGALTVEGRRRPPEDEADLWLLFAPLKRGRIDYLAEKATELGVSRLQPVISRFTSVSRVNCARLAANAREAAEQCERLSVPAVAEAIELMRLIGDWPAGRRLLICAERGPAPPIAAVLAEAARRDPDARTRGWAILIGPEGGFAQSELDALADLPFVTAVSLGPRILRAETAAVAALACWQALLGDGPAQRA